MSKATKATKATKAKAVSAMTSAVALDLVISAAVALDSAKGSADNSYKEAMEGYFIPTFGTAVMAGFKATKCRSPEGIKAHASDLGCTAALLASLMTDQSAMYELAKARDISGSAVWQSMKRAFFGRKAPVAGEAAKTAKDAGSEEALSIAKAVEQSPTMAGIALAQFIEGLNALASKQAKAKIDNTAVLEARDHCAAALEVLRKAK